MTILKMTAIGALLIGATAAMAQPVQRKGYVRSDGTYVAPSYSSRPNDTKLDNYSTRGNINPYNGKEGTVDPYAPPPPPSYGSTYGSKRKSPY